jgi:hypothetical protein
MREFETVEHLVGVVDDTQFAEHRHRVLEVCEIQFRDQFSVNALRRQLLIARLVLDPSPHHSGSETDPAPVTLR